MRIFDETKTVELTEYDLTKGYLKPDVIETEVEEQPAIEEQFHYEVVKEYENGGKDIQKVLDVEGKPYVPAYTDIEEIHIYIPYTEKELEEKAASQEIAELKAKLAASDYKAIKYGEGVISVAEYAPIRSERQAWRERIGELEKKVTL